MYVLAINAGSQTLKYKLYQAKDFGLVKGGEIKDIGFGEIGNHREALNKAKENLKEYKFEIKIIGHRYVNGGQEFIEPEVIDSEKLSRLEKYHHLAPLHNPANLEGIRAALETISGAVNVAVFDTFFYKDLPRYVFRYAISKQVTDKYGYRKLGFHGTSHRFAVWKAAQELGRDLNELKIISLHLGGGASITAVKNGKAVDTSMGFTPTEGLVMMTRSGDIDPGIIVDLASKGWSAKDIDNLLNNESGLYGLCGKKGMLEVLDNLEDPQVKAAFEIYVYRIKKYLGAYFAILGGCDAVVFTGTVGSGREETRRAILEDMSFLKDAEIKVIPADEEYLIAKDAWEKFQTI